MLSSVNIFAHFSDLSWYAGLLPITHIYYTFPNEGFSLLQYNCLKVSSCNVRWVFLVFLFLLKATTFLWCVLIPPHLPFFLFLILKEQVCYDLLLDHWFLLVCCCCCFGAFFYRHKGKVKKRISQLWKETLKYNWYCSIICFGKYEVT